MKKLFALLLQVIFFACSSPLAFAQQSEPTDNQAAATSHKKLTEDEKISHLINYVRNLNDAKFIRNGEEFTPAKAADHLQSKWDKHKKKVKTAQDFVDKLASFSKTKEPYQIRYNDGRTIKCGDVLNKELKRIES